MVKGCKEILRDKILSVKEASVDIFKKFIVPAQSKEMVDRYFWTIVISLILWPVLRDGIVTIIDRMKQLYDKLDWLHDLILYKEFIELLRGVVLIVILLLVILFPSYFYKGKPIERLKIGFFFFEYNSFYKKRFLKEKYKIVRDIIAIFLCVVLGSEVIDSWVKKFWGKERLLDFFNFDGLEKIFLIYILVLIYKIFSGYTKLEYEKRLYYDREDSPQKKVINYVGMIEEIDSTSCILLRKTSVDKLTEIQKKVKIRNREEAFLYRNSGSLNHIELMEKLLKENSVLTDTPFYKDLGIALFLPLHRFLLKGKKIIFFSGGSEGSKEITSWIREGIKSVTQMQECWKIVNVVERKKPWDIGVIVPDDMRMLYDIEEFQQNQSGFVIVMLHPENILLEAQNELYEWGYWLSRQNVPPIYVIIERAILGLLDLVSHIFRAEFKYISKAAEPASINRIYVLDGERRDVYHEKMQMTPNIGMEGMLATFAENVGLGDAYWMAGDKIAYYDVNSIKLQHPNEERGFMCAKLDSVSCKAGLWGIPQKASSCLIVSDEINNIWELLRQLKTRGTDVGVISVVSNRYLLLPYMLNNIETFKNDLYAISAMTVDIAECSLNRSIILTKIMLNNQMTTEEIRSYRSVYNEDKNEGPWLTEEERDNIESELKNHLGCEVTIEQSEDKRYYIRSYEELCEICELISSPAYYYDEEEQKKTFIGGKHIWQLDQNYLPGQMVVLSGKLYLVHGKETLFLDDGWQTVLRVKRYRSGIIYFQRYYQDRVYKIYEPILVGVYQKHRFGVKWKMLHVSFGVETRGYYIITSNKVEYTHLTEVEERSYKGQLTRKNAISLKFDKPLSAQERRTMIIILNEVIKTLFPGGYAYIAIVTSLVRDEITPDLQHLYYDLKSDFVGDYDILILEDCKFELGILRMINKHMEHILRIVYSYCKWWHEDTDKGDKKRLMDITIIPKSIWDNVMQETASLISIWDNESLCTLDQYRTERDNIIHKKEGESDGN